MMWIGVVAMVVLAAAFVKVRQQRKASSKASSH
jgi:hypothetical protein